MPVQERIVALRDEMTRYRIDAFLIRHNANLRWLTGMEGVFDEEEAHAALVTQRQLFLHTDSRYIDAFSRRLGTTSWHISGERQSHADFCIRSLKAKPGKRIAIEHDIPLSEYRELVRGFNGHSINAQLVETRNIIENLRAVKDESEIVKMREAQAITDAAFSHMCEWMHAGVTEAQAALELEYFMRSQGSEGVAFASIVAAGENGAAPHSVPSSRVLGKGDMVVMDFGARVADYRADMTRTVCIGQPSAEQRRVYDIVCEANERCEAMIRTGVTASDVHNLAVKIIDDAGYGGTFGHGLGHGVGIDIHEYPVLSPRNGAPLKAGNVVTVEPGIYLPGRFGVRIEDYGVVRDDGFERFTQSSHELVVL